MLQVQTHHKALFRNVFPIPYLQLRSFTLLKCYLIVVLGGVFPIPYLQLRSFTLLKCYLIVALGGHCYECMC